MLGVIVFAHGSRDPLWRLPVESVAQQIARSDPAAAVSCAYLELCEPDMATAVRQMVEAGATRVRVLPLVLRHGQTCARRPAGADERPRSKPTRTVRFEQLPAAGEDPRLTALLAQIALETAP